jgi:hypothetical protein
MQLELHVSGQQDTHLLLYILIDGGSVHPLVNLHVLLVLLLPLGLFCLGIDGSDLLVMLLEVPV